MQASIDLSDGDLARAVAGRGPGLAEAAEAELYRPLAPRVRLYGLRHLRDEDAARDLVQQVMLLAIEKLRGGARSCAKPSCPRPRSKLPPDTPHSTSITSRHASPSSPIASAWSSF